MEKEERIRGKKAVFVLVSAFIVVLLIIELALRIGAHLVFGVPYWDVRRYIRDKELCWRMNPGYIGPISGCDHIEINQYGFRGKDYTEVPKTDRTLRLMILGDSNTVGWALPLDDSLYTEVMGRYLEAKLGEMRKVEIANCGTIGYSSYQGVILLERYFDIVKPDMVILMFGANDAVVFAQSDKVKLDPLSGSIFIGTLDHIMIYYATKQLVRKFLKEVVLSKERMQLEQLDNRPKSLSLRVPPPDFKENLQRMAQYVSSKGAELVIITYPSVKEDAKLKSIMCQYHQASFDVANNQGVYVFDFASIADSYQTDEIYLNYPPDPVHLNYTGHRLLGENLGEYIYKIFIVPSQ